MSIECLLYGNNGADGYKCIIYVNPYNSSISEIMELVPCIDKLEAQRS